MDMDELEVEELHTFVDEDGVEQDVMSAYNPVIEGDDEVVEADLTMNETFKIDERMPDELKAQLAMFNEKSKSLNEILTTNYTVDIPEEEVVGDENNDDDGDDDIEEDSITDISEDGEEVGNLF